MKTIASLEADVAVELTDKLKAEAIPYEVRSNTQEGGLDYSEIIVEDAYYDRACDVAEAWEAQHISDEERRANRHCPRCDSVHLEYIGRDSIVGGNVWKCKNCGNGFAT